MRTHRILKTEYKKAVQAGLAGMIRNFNMYYCAKCNCKHFLHSEQGKKHLRYGRQMRSDDDG